MTWEVVLALSIVAGIVVYLLKCFHLRGAIEQLKRELGGD